MFKVVIASNNPGKIEEIETLLVGLPLELIPQKNFSIPDVDETGGTFVENAIIKARHACKISGLPALADDSGLAVDVLDGAPGVYSARYAGPHAKDSNLIAKLLAELKGVPPEERTACFHCVICLMEHPNDPAPLICHGIWEGVIAMEPIGKYGFGYDPIFYVPEFACTAAEMDRFEKNKISHRGQALSEFSQILHDVMLDDSSQ